MGWCCVNEGEDGVLDFLLGPCCCLAGMIFMANDTTAPLSILYGMYDMKLNG